MRLRCASSVRSTRRRAAHIPRCARRRGCGYHGWPAPGPDQCTPSRFRGPSKSAKMPSPGRSLNASLWVRRRSGPVRSDGVVVDEENCAAVCRPCHLKKTAQEAAAGRNRWNAPERHPFDVLSSEPVIKTIMTTQLTKLVDVLRAQIRDREADDLVRTVRSGKSCAALLERIRQHPRTSAAIQAIAIQWPSLMEFVLPPPSKTKPARSNAFMKSASSSAHAVGASATASTPTNATTMIFIRRLLHTCTRRTAAV